MCSSVSLKMLCFSLPYKYCNSRVHVHLPTHVCDFSILNGILSIPSWLAFQCTTCRYLFAVVSVLILVCKENISFLARFLERILYVVTMDDATVTLPCDNPERWQKLCRLFLLLAQCKKLKELEQLALMVKNGTRLISRACP